MSANEPPVAFQGDLANLPDALALLKKLDNWVGWKWEVRVNKRGEVEWTKPPYQPKHPNLKASSNKPATWAPYEEGLAGYRNSQFHGIGFVLLNTSFGAQDIDDCRDPDTGAIAPEAMAIVNRAGSYTEITPSGTGLRIIGHASGARVHRKQKIPGSAVTVESYRGAERYITITGKQLPGTWPYIADIDAVIDAVVAELDGKPATGQGDLADAPDAGKDNTTQADLEAEFATPPITQGNPGDAPANSNTAHPFGDTFLPPELKALVASAVPPDKDHSGEFHHAVCWLGDCGWSAERIESYIAGKPIVPERFIKRLGKEIARCLKKRRANPDTGAALPGASTPPPAGKSEPDESTLGGFDTTADWTRPEGLLGKMADWIMLTSRRPNRPLAVASAVTVLSAACGRHLYGPTGTALNVYVVALAGTATGKDRPLAAPGVILKAAGFERLHTTAKAFSVSAFEQMMIDYPCCVATVDEIGASLFARMSHKHSSTHEQGIRGVLLELWSRDQFKGPFSTTRHAQRGAPKVAGTVAIPWPNLTLLGVSTPEAFYAAVTTGSVRDGFLNRFLLCLAAPRGKAQEVVEESGKVPQDIVDALHNLVPRLGLVVPKSISDLDAPLEDVIRRLPWADDNARERAQQLEEQILVKIDGDPETAPLWGRVFEYAVRLASLHAVSRAGPHATVTLDDLAWGTAWASQSARTMIEGVRNLMASNEYEAKFNLVRNIVREADQITRTTLLRSVRSISARDRDDVIRHLIEAGLIEELQIASKGRTAKGWRWLG